MKYDVVVIGMGLSGLVAALAAASAGRECLVVAKGCSGHYHSGIIDLGTGDPLVDNNGPVIPGQPVHPYRLAGAMAVQGGLELFCRAVRESGYPYTRVDRGSCLLLTAMGTLRQGDVVPFTMENGNLLSGARLLVVGFEGYGDFFPGYVAGNVNRRLNLLGLGGTAKGVMVRVAGTDLSGCNAYDLATHFERDEFCRSVAREVSIKVKGFDAVGFPAVLGSRQAGEVLGELQELLGVPVFEIPTFLPSVPGMRLFNALKDYLTGHGVKFMTGFGVISAQTRNQRCEAVWLDTPGRPGRVSADTYILATGGIVGGGLEVTPEIIREPLFGLPVAQPPAYRRTVEQWLAGQPYARSGLMVNELLQPVDEEGRVCLENVHVTGRNLGGYDPFADRCGSGVAIATGYLAGSLAGGGASHAGT
ncbi:hypothetical protein SY88_10950 [Clostridiales bacterium PH28_bin88]|nr:hypothetical protein SY88_10950 [Clostridiales bacterium PH28_bin88]